ncbi:MAG: nucleotidyltransferase domain-containing protein [Candidatus Woesearchaeota archaeon]
MVLNHNTMVLSNNKKESKIINLKKTDFKEEYLNILRILIENSDKVYSIRKLSLQRNINYKSAYYVILKLKEYNIIDLEKQGNTSFVKFNFNFHDSVFLVENQRKKDFLKNDDFNVLYNRISQNIKNPFFILLVFGSYAKGTQTKNSDLDLCLITDNENIKKEINLIIETIPYEIHFLDFTTNEFLKMLKTTDFNISKEIVNNKIILNGIELFYNLINRYKKNK